MNIPDNCFVEKRVFWRMADTSQRRIPSDNLEKFVIIHMERTPNKTIAC